MKLLYTVSLSICAIAPLYAMQDFVVPNVLSPMQMGQQAEQLLYAKRIEDELRKRDEKPIKSKQAVTTVKINKQLLNEMRNNIQGYIKVLDMCLLAANNRNIQDGENVVLREAAAHDLWQHLHDIEEIITKNLPMPIISDKEQQACGSENKTSEIQLQPEHRGIVWGTYIRED